MGNFGLIDLDTPKDVYHKTSYRDGSTMALVFSDEFNTDGRTFYPGDDPYWEAVDLHYWAGVFPLPLDDILTEFTQATNNLEWYDPAAVTTSNGSLVITLSEISTHGLGYQGGAYTVLSYFFIN